LIQKEKILPISLFGELDRSGPIPLYYQVSQILQKAILGEDLPAGSRLENEISLANRLGLSRPTIRRSIQELVDKGLLVRRRGIGTQVVLGQVTRGLELTSLHEDLERSGKKPATRLLKLETKTADAKTAESLGVAVGSPVLFIRRLRLADRVPVAILDNWLPAEFLDIQEGDLIRQGLYQILRERGVSMKVAKQRIGARRASASETELLDIEKGAAVLTADRTTYDNSGKAIEVGHHCYRPDLYSFEITLIEK
jgi:DNA-binding GntR family transcriptional regulator